MEHKQLSNDELRAQMDEEARISESAAYDDSDADAPLPDHVQVSRPNRSRSKVLQVRLNDDEFEAIESIAAARHVPVSTVARDQLISLINQVRAQEPGSLTVQVAQLVEIATKLQASIVTESGGPLTPRVSSPAVVSRLRK